MREEGRVKGGRTQSILKHCTAGWPLHLSSPGLHPWLIPALVEVGLVCLSYIKMLKVYPTCRQIQKPFFLNESCLTNLTLNDFNFSLVSICESFLSGLLLCSFPLRLQTCCASYLGGEGRQNLLVFFDLAILKSVS